MRVMATGDLKPELWNSDQGEQTVFTMMANHVGASLIGQDVAISKASSQSGGQQSSQQGGQQYDPWGSQPRSETGGFGSGGQEPPF